jgi:hypothetical protein
MHDLTATLSDGDYNFREGGTVCTESSRKYNREVFRVIVERGGLERGPGRTTSGCFAYSRSRLRRPGGVRADVSTRRVLAKHKTEDARW